MIFANKISFYMNMPICHNIKPSSKYGGHTIFVVVHQVSVVCQART